MKLTTIFAALLFAAALTAAAQQQPQGIFTNTADIGTTKPGASVYDPKARTWKVTGGGADVWFAADDYRFTWVKMRGDVSLSADIAFTPLPSQPLAKAMLMVRQSEDPASPYADIAIHADGHITLQYRATTANQTEDKVAPEHMSKRLKLERKGNVFTAYALKPDGSMDAFATYTVPMTGEVLVGIGVCAHDANGLATATFSNVKLEHAAH